MERSVLSSWFWVPGPSFVRSPWSSDCEGKPGCFAAGNRSTAWDRGPSTMDGLRTKHQPPRTRLRTIESRSNVLEPKAPGTLKCRPRGARFLRRTGVAEGGDPHRSGRRASRAGHRADGARSRARLLPRERLRLRSARSGRDDRRALHHTMGHALLRADVRV